jgi:hypothetical protein
MGGPKRVIQFHDKEKNMKRITFLKTTALLGFAVSANAQTADQPCSNATLKGAYGLQLSGTRAAPFVIPGAPGFIGQLEYVIGTVIQIFDGNGNFTQVDNVKGSISGIVPDRAGRGTYTVNPDCTVIQIVSPPGQAPITSKGVIVDSGKEFRQNTVSPDTFFIMTIGRKITTT